MHNAQPLLSRFDSVQPASGEQQWSALCPCHPDNKNSLSIGRGVDGRWLIRCHAGCTTEEILAAKGLAMADLFPQNNGHVKTNGTHRGTKAGTWDREYTYYDRDRRPIHRTVRFRDPKGFIQQQYDSQTGRWKNGLKGVTPVLYQLPELVQRIAKYKAAGRIPKILVCEGEKDCDSLSRVNILATTNPMGATHWKPHYNETLRGVDVVILPDNDDAGREHARTVSAALHGVANSVKIVELPNLPDKGDASDWLERHGLTHETLVHDELVRGIKTALVELIDAAPVWQPPADVAVADAKRGVGGVEYNGSGEVDGETLAFHYLHGRPRHVFTNGSVHVWAGGRYIARVDSHFRALVRKAIAAYVSDVNAEAARTCKEGETPKTITVSMAMVSNAIDAAKAMTALTEEVQPPAWIDGSDRSRNCLVMKNGILDVDRVVASEADVLTEHSDGFFTLVALPYPFEPEAACPNWLAFLQRNLEADAERIALLQEFFGYCLVPDTSFHRFLLLHGEGSNGKSVICAALRAVLGTENVSTVPLEAFGERFSLNATLGKLANVCAEIGEIDKVAEGHLKSFVSGDPMTFERKFKDPIVALPTARLVLATNTLPRFSDRSGGLWRRMIVMPCNVIIQEHERVFGMDNPAFWTPELPGILNWAIEGLRRLRAQKRFTVSKLVERAREEYRAEMNPLRSFLTDHFHENHASQVPTKDVYRRYVEWCESNGYKPLGERMFGREIKREFPKVERRKFGTRAERVYYYVGLADGPEPPAALDGQWS